MKLWKSITIGAVVGGAVYFGLIFLTASLYSFEFGKIIADFIAYAPEHLCFWLSNVFFGPNSGDAGMIFIIPAWISIGILVGAMCGVIIAVVSKKINNTQQAGPRYPPQGVGSPDP